jgi:hypothetical protein
MKFARKENFKNIEDKMYESVKPSGTDNYIGLELEISSKVPRNIITWELAKLGIKVAVGTDGSIKKNAYTVDTAEVRCLIKQSEITTAVPLIVAKLKELGASVNKTCGMHVHLDMRNRDVKECYKALVKKQKVLREMVAKHRLTSGYCKENKHKDFDTAISGEYKEKRRYDSWSRSWYKDKVCTKQPEGRSAINPNSYDKHQTLEVRLHEGTLNDKKIITWVKKLVEIVDGAA